MRSQIDRCRIFQRPYLPTDTCLAHSTGCLLEWTSAVEVCFALQDEVAVAVVSTIQPKLFQTEIGMATRRRLENLTAYDILLRAMPRFYNATRDGIAEAMRLAHRALELELRFGSAACLASI